MQTHNRCTFFDRDIHKCARYIAKRILHCLPAVTSCVRPHS